MHDHVCVGNLDAEIKAAKKAFLDIALAVPCPESSARGGRLRWVGKPRRSSCWANTLPARRMLIWVRHPLAQHAVRAAPRPVHDQNAVHHEERRIVLEYTHASLEAEYGCNIDCQVNVGGSETVCSFFHRSSMAGLATCARVWPKLGRPH